MLKGEDMGNKSLIPSLDSRYWDMFANISFTAVFFEVKKIPLCKKVKGIVWWKTLTHISSNSVMNAMMKYIQVPTDAWNFDYTVGLKRVAVRLYKSSSKV